jgi:hypothetical protein
MKRLFALTLIFCLLLGLAACAGTPAAAPETGKTGTAAGPAPAGTSPAGMGAAADGEPGLFTPEIASDASGGVSFYYEGKASDSGSIHFGEGGDPTPALPEEPAPEAGEGEPGDDDPIVIDDPVYPDEPVNDPGEALKLTAAEWNDNKNWPFFTNLVNAGTISFPSFGLDPRNRIAVTVTDAAGAPLANETVTLLDADGGLLWTARTDKTGTAYLFFAEGQTPDRTVCGEAFAEVRVPEAGGDPQGQTVMRPLDAVTLTASASAPAQTSLQVMFIVDTTGSMGDEIAYLQKDFSAIAERVGSNGVTWSVSFYRDQDDDYVTRHNPFTSDVAEIQAKINAEYASGGGDTPEAVAEVLTECLTDRTDWDESCVKLAFLIFDAPPHEGKEAALQAAVKAAAEKGIRVIPVVASNAERDTELFGRALAILTNGTYVFLTDDSGVGGSHLEPIVGDYDVELLQDLIVRLITEAKPA